jgi:hypothetical protein
MPAASLSAIKSCNRPVLIASDSVNMLKSLAESAMLCNTQGGASAREVATLPNAGHR